MRIRRPGESNDDTQSAVPGKLGFGERIGMIVPGFLFGGVASVFVCAGIYMTISSIRDFYTWPAAPARITHTLASDELSAEPNSLPDKVQYSYAVADRQYTGGIPLGNDTPDNRRKLQVYKSGELVTIHYNPSKPEESRLDIKPEPALLGFSIFALPFLTIGLNALLATFTGRGLEAFRRTDSSNSMPAGATFGVLVGLCALGCFLQIGLGIVLPWQVATATGVALLVGLPVASYKIGLAIQRRKARQQAAGSDNSDSSSSLNLNDPNISLKKKLTFLLFATVFWCGITGVFVCVAVGSIIKHEIAKRRFATTTGVIIASKMDSHKSDHSTTYSANIRYRYIVAANTYVGTQYAYGMASTSEQDYISGILANHPVGKEVPVYYDPTNPSEAILRLNVPSFHYFLLLFLQPFLLVGLGMICWCIVLPLNHKTLRQFLNARPALPWRIPFWGVMRQEYRGVTIRSRIHPLRPLAYFLGGYGGTCFIAIFVVAFAFGGFGEAKPQAVAGAFIVAAAAGVLAAINNLLGFFRTPAVVTIDQAGRRLAVRTFRRNVEVPLNIKEWRLREIHYSRGVTVNNSNVKYHLLEAITKDGLCVPLHAFGRSTDGAAQNIALRVAGELASIAGGNVNPAVVSPSDLAENDPALSINKKDSNYGDIA